MHKVAAEMMPPPFGPPVGLAAITQAEADRLVNAGTRVIREFELEKYFVATDGGMFGKWIAAGLLIYAVGTVYGPKVVIMSQIVKAVRKQQAEARPKTAAEMVGGAAPVKQKNGGGIDLSALHSDPSYQ